MDAKLGGTDDNRGDTVIKRVEFWGSTDPSAPVFIFWGLTGRFVLPREDLLDLSSRFAFRLSKHGIKSRDVVCIAIPNSPERVVVDLGVHLAGATPMNCQVLRADGQDIIESMKLAHCKMLVVDPGIVDGAWGICKQHLDIANIHDDYGEITCADISTLTVVEFCRSHKPEMKFLKSLQNEGKLVLHSQQPSDSAYFITTSGSSGFTKIVSHTHKSILGIAQVYNDCCTKTTGQEIYCSCAPLGWIGGLPLNFLHSGCPRLLFDDANGEIPDKLQTLWKMMSTEVTHAASLMPVHYMGLYALTDTWKSSGFKLKCLISGGQSIKQAHLEVIGHLTDSLFCLYSSSEFGAISGMNISSGNTNRFSENSAGQPLDGFEIRIVDENLKDVATVSRGEILVRSNNICKEYVGRKCSSFLEDGWFRTDDIGHIHTNGFLVLEGRSSDAIMHGAYILYPYWLEKKLKNCPGVKVIVIVPVPDPDLHHEICVCVKPDDSANFRAEHIIEFCKELMDVELTSSMKFIPKYALMFDAFPLTKTAKLDRRQTAVLAKDRLNL